jgi:isopenicillin N synthase-like dioxygenase
MPVFLVFYRIHCLSTQLLHTEVLGPLHPFLTIALELPEDYFRNIHKYQAKSEDHLRYMKYTKFTPIPPLATTGPVATLVRVLWPTRTHLLIMSRFADLGSFMLIFRQSIAALQIRDPVHNEWKWVKPQDATLTVNARDTISLLTGGYVRSTIHQYGTRPTQNLVSYA